MHINKQGNSVSQAQSHLEPSQYQIISKECFHHYYHRQYMLATKSPIKHTIVAKKLWRDGKERQNISVHLIAMQEVVGMICGDEIMNWNIGDSCRLFEYEG